MLPMLLALDTLELTLPAPSTPLFNIPMIYLRCYCFAVALLTLVVTPNTRALDDFANEPTVRVMSFNIRYGTANDGDNHWDRRKEFLIETIREFEPDLLGTQETLGFQRDFIAEHISTLEMFGAGRDDGQNGGEMAALGYRKDRFEKIDGGHFWLSPNPNSVGSKGWDAALPRIASWVKLRDKRQFANSPILFLNTHFDHRGAMARAESAKLIRTRLIELGQGCRIVLTGDFNASSDSDPYRSLFGLDAASIASPVVDTFLASTIEDGKAVGTFSGFKSSNISGPRIDWIGCSRDWSIRQSQIARVERNGTTPSDHFPVTAILRTKLTGDSRSLRFLSYNIHHGEGTDRRIDLLRIARIVRGCDPDLVALQEVDKKTKRSLNVDQTMELMRLTGMHGVFGKAIDFEGGEYGQAVLSRTSILSSQVHLLPSGNREQRIALDVRTKTGDLEIRFASTHLDHQQESFRLQQTEMLNALFQQTTVATFLAGDFNASDGSAPIAKLRESWSFPNTSKSHFTIPSDSPSRQIDFIVPHRNAKWQHGESEVLAEPLASDHLPIFSVFRSVE